MFRWLAGSVIPARYHDEIRGLAGETKGRGAPEGFQPAVTCFYNLAGKKVSRAELLQLAVFWFSGFDTHGFSAEITCRNKEPVILVVGGVVEIQLVMDARFRQVMYSARPVMSSYRKFFAGPADKDGIAFCLEFVRSRSRGYSKERRSAANLRARSMGMIAQGKF